ncbi:hypothetical protein Tco_0277714, partial [Tanacetum coccineum]
KQKSKRKQRKEAKVAQDDTEHEESIPTPSNDPLTSGEDSMQLNDLMVLCTKLQTQVLDLEKAKDAQAKEIADLKKRVKRLERKKKSRTTCLKRINKVGMSRRVESSEDQESLGDHEDASKQGRSIEDIDVDAEVTLVNETQERQNEDLMFDIGILDDDEMFVEATISKKDKQSIKLDDSIAGEAVTTASVECSAALTTIKEITLDQTLIQIKAAKPKVKQRIEEDKESDELEEVEEDDEDELKKHLVIKKDEDIAIDAIPLATKLPVIIDYKLHKEGMLVHYQLIRADGSSKRYSSMIIMLQGIDREDLEALWRIVKTKYSDIRPEDEFKRVLWGDLKVMFEPDKRSDVWRILQGYMVTIWKLINSSRVYFVSAAGEKITTADYNCLKTFYCQENKDELKR